MIEEEKQQDFISQQAESSSVASEKQTSNSAQGLGSVESNSNQPIPGQSQTDLGSTLEATPIHADEIGVTAEDVSETAAAQDSEAGTLENLQREVEALKAQLADSTNQYDSLKTQYVRMGADFDNFRKRTAKEKEELEVQIKCTTIKELLSVVDNFERARSQIKPQTDAEMTIHKSYQSVYKQLVDSLKRLGVSPMRPEGEEFDPNLHNAVMRQPTDEHPEGTVIEELMRGYFLGDRVLRHAMVKVAAAPETVAAAEETNPTTTEI